MFDFKLISQKEMEEHIKSVFNKSGIQFDDDAVSLIARSGNGSMRDALSIADMCSSYSHNNITYLDVITVLGTSTQEKIVSLAENILSSNAIGFIEEFSKEIRDGKNAVTLFQDISKCLRNMIVLKTAGVSKELVLLPQNEQEKLLQASKDFSLARINECFVECSEALGDLKFSLDPQLMIETVVLKLCEKIEPKKQEILTPHKIWGQVLLELSKVNIIVHSALAGITDISMTDKEFLINIENSSVSEMVKKQENYSDLVACFRKVGYNYSVIINNVEESGEDKAKLISEKLGVNINIK